MKNNNCCASLDYSSTEKRTKFDETFVKYRLMACSGRKITSQHFHPQYTDWLNLAIDLHLMFSFSPSMNLPRKARGKEGKTLIGEMAVWYWLKMELLMIWQYRIGLTTWQKKEFITGETKAGDSEAKEKEKEKKGKKKTNWV